METSSRFSIYPRTSTSNGSVRWQEAAATGGAVAGSAGALGIAIQLQLGLILYILIPVSILLLSFLVVALKSMHDMRRNVTQLAERIDYLATARGSLLPQRLSEGSFEVYLRYKTLPAADFAAVLQTIDDIYRFTYGLLVIPESIERNNDLSDLQVFLDAVEEMLRASPADRLEIEAIETGESIKFRLKTGWLPSFGIEDEDIVVRLPNGLAAVTIAGTLITAGTNYGVDTVKTGLEAVKTYKEIQKLDMELGELETKHKNASPEVQTEFDNKIKKLKDLTVRNAEIKGAEVRVQPFTSRRRKWSHN